MNFLNPALLAGAALFAVPLIIHLLNRQRHKKRPWAAMEFLLRAYQKQRNRLRNENLLLLLLRCLIPILLALAVARPLLEKAAGLLSDGGIVHHVFVLDASYSMGLRQDGAESPFERARTMVGKLLDRFEQNPNRNDKITLVTAGVRPRFVVRGDMQLATARAAWLLLQKPEDAAGDLTEALQQTADALEEAKDASVQVYVFSDMQEQAFGRLLTEQDGEQQPELQDTMRDLVERIQGTEGTQLHWIDVGPFSDAASAPLVPAAGDPNAGNENAQLDNVQIIGLAISDPAAIQKMPAEVIATLRNNGTSTATCEVTLDIDGGEPMRKIVQVPAGAEGEADFQMVFRTPGKHRVRAALLPDALPADDERFLTVDVRDRIRILLVDGKAGTDPLKSYAYLWEAMLDPDETALPTFSVETVDLVTLLSGQCQPKDYDVVVLADVERLNQRAATALTDAMRAGRGVLFQFGERSDIESYNLHLHQAGDGPMPFRLTSVIGGAAGSTTVRSPVIADLEHPVLREFEEDVYREILQAIPLSRWYGVAAESIGEQAKVVLRVTDAEQTPLLISRGFGEGQALFLMSPIGSEYDADRWNRLDDPLVAFPLLHGLAKWLALPSTDPFAAAVGSELTCSLPARPLDIEVERPERDGRSRTPVATAARPLPGGRYALPPFANTVYAGFYTFEMQLDQEAGREPLQLPFAVNVDPDEGRLLYPGNPRIQRELGIEKVLQALPTSAEADVDSDRNELGPTFLLLTLLFVLGEAALARYIAARRS